MGVATADEPTEARSSSWLTRLYRRNQELQVPSPKDYGIDEDKYFDAIPLMAAQALASGSPQNNPRVPSVEEIEALYHQVWA